MPIRLLSCFKISLLLFTVSAFQLKQDNGDVALKAELLYSLSKFVSWPEDSLDDTFKIHIIGDEHFFEYTNYVYEGRQIKNRPIQVSHNSNGEAFRNNYHIVYISTNSYEYLDTILADSTGQPTLLVSEGMDIAHSGLMVNIQEVQGNIVLELNPESAQAAGLNMGYQLLQVAKRVLKTSNKWTLFLGSNPSN